MKKGSSRGKKELTAEERRIKSLEEEVERLRILSYILEAERDIAWEEVAEEIATLKKRGHDPERLKLLEASMAAHLVRRAEQSG